MSVSRDPASSFLPRTDFSGPGAPGLLVSCPLGGASGAEASQRTQKSPCWASCLLYTKGHQREGWLLTWRGVQQSHKSCRRHLPGRQKIVTICFSQCDQISHKTQLAGGDVPFRTRINLPLPGEDAGANLDANGIAPLELVTERLRVSVSYMLSVLPYAVREAAALLVGA